MSKFDTYVLLGDRAIHLHPDIEQLEYGACASDVIADILHAVFDRHGGPMEDGITPEGLVERAVRCYYGDQEDRELPPPRGNGPRLNVITSDPRD